MDAPVEVEAEDGDPGEAADEDKVEEVAKEAAHVVLRQAVRCRISTTKTFVKKTMKHWQNLQMMLEQVSCQVVGLVSLNTK